MTTTTIHLPAIRSLQHVVLCIILGVCSFSQVSRAQNASIADSLIQILPQYTDEDTSKVLLLVRIAYQLPEYNHAIQYAAQALEISEKLAYKRSSAA